MWKHEKSNGSIGEIYLKVKLCHGGGCLNLALSLLNYKANALKIVRNIC